MEVKISIALKRDFLPTSSSGRKRRRRRRRRRRV
jgi:hypothetical protein